MAVRLPAADYITPFEDSRRWAHVVARHDDIVIATPPKSGTTWMQGIVSSLLWPEGDAPGRIGMRSPWVDGRGTAAEAMIEAVEGQTHRRFLKTHSPADSIPIWPDTTYILVYRDPPDALVSWGNHRRTMRSEIVAALNSESAVDGVPAIPLVFEGDYHLLYDEWSRYCSPLQLLASWWPLRHEPNVHLFHYADLMADLAGEMRRIATALQIQIADADWADVVDRCRLDRMREQAVAAGGMDRGFIGGVDSFYYRGGNGRGAELLPEALIDRLQRDCADRLGVGGTAELSAVDWLAAGSLATQRP